MIIVAGCGVGAAVIKLDYDTTKLLYKLATQGLVKTVGGMSPGAIMEMIAMGLDIWTILQDVMNPPGPDTPGATYRRIVTSFCSVRLSLQALNMILCACGLENPITDQVMQCIELLITVANFGLNTAAALEEMDATSWKEYDVETTLIASGDNLVETVKGIGCFCAFKFKEKNSPVALGGVVCMTVAGTLAVGSKYLKYRKQYHRELEEI